MSRSLRLYDEAGYIHIVLRGNAQHNIFFDDMDRFKILKEIKKYSIEMQNQVLAYCLMDNHVHLIVHDEKLQFSEYMKKVEIAYVSYFNAKYSRCGHLFQDRFYSKSITNDSQLLCAIRYVHLNPQEAGICDFTNYYWSSYKEYISNAQICNTNLVMEMFGEKKNFIDFHQDNVEYKLENTTLIDDPTAEKIMLEIIGANDINVLKKLSISCRNQFLSEMKLQGLSIRQISRITGISKSVVHRA